MCVNSIYNTENKNLYLFTNACLEEVTIKVQSIKIYSNNCNLLQMHEKHLGKIKLLQRCRLYLKLLNGQKRGGLHW
jgi:hypothetical protein